VGQVAFNNAISGVYRDLLKVESGSKRGEEPNLYFRLHPFEELLLERLENVKTTLTVDGKPANAIQVPAVYEEAKQIGYLDEEVEPLIEILKARGMADSSKKAGVTYHYLVETSINFSELQTKLGEIRENVNLANTNGLQYQCAHLSAAERLDATPGIENDEVQKDTLRQKIKLAETNLKNKCAEWVTKRHQNLMRKNNELETLIREMPRVLEQTTGHPLTDFSQILFQSVQVQVRDAYRKVSDQIRREQTEVQGTCNKEIGAYQADRTPKNAIETAARLETSCTKINKEIARIKQDGEKVEQLFSYFERWRVFASQVEGAIQLMTDSKEDAAVQNLIERFNVVQRDIRQHLADNRLSLNDVLGNHEHFKDQIETIKAEFHQILTRKKDAFIDYQNKITEQLQRLPVSPPQLVDFNPIDSAGCYRKVRENTIMTLKSVIDDVQSESENRKRELLKPIKVFTAVPDSLKKEATQLHEDIGELMNEFQNIRRSFTSEEVNREKLSEWIEQIDSKLIVGQAISDRRRQFERKLDTLTPNVSERSRMLQEGLKDQVDFTELIVQLLSEGTFRSTKEILECLEELYQANLVNLTVRRK